MRELIDDGIRRILEDHATPRLLGAAERGDWPQPLWHMLEENGFTRALCGSPNGGAEASWPDVQPMLVACGYHALPLPLPETLLASWLLERAGIEVPSGPLGLPDQDAASSPTLSKPGGHWQLDGELKHVPWGRHCRHLVVHAEHQGEHFIALLETGSLPTRHLLNLAREPRATFVLQGVRPLRVARSPLGHHDPIRLCGALLRAAQASGAAQRALEQAVRYAGERHQFGRPLARFQAVQQQIASAVSEVAAVTAAVGQAGSGDDPLAGECAIAIAKITACEAAGKVAAVSHAVHGAIGYTAEHSLHHVTQRLQAWRHEFGNWRWWSERLGHAICARGADRLWASAVDCDLDLRPSLKEIA